MEYSATVLNGNLGVGFHTALRKATDHDWSVPAWHAINAMADGQYRRLIQDIVANHDVTSDNLRQVIEATLESVRNSSSCLEILRYSLSKLPDNEWRSVTEFVSEGMDLAQELEDSSAHAEDEGKGSR